MMKIKLTDEQRESLENAKWRAKVRLNNAINWGISHADILIPVLAITVPAAAKITHDVHRDNKERREDEHRRLRMYDPVIGDYVDLKRQLTPEERVAVSQRRRNGETVSEIIYDMRLAK